MPSTYSSSLNLELMATGEQSGTWGTKANTNLQLLDEALAGYTQVSVSAVVTLEVAQASSSPGRNAFIEIVGGYPTSGTVPVRVPALEKGYFIKVSVSTSGVLSFNIAVSGQGGATVTCVSAANRVQILPWTQFICDGTSVWQAGSGFIPGSSFTYGADGLTTVAGVLSSVAAQGTGLVAKTAVGAVINRTISAAPNEVSINEGAGVSANPRIGLAAAISFPGTWSNFVTTISVSASTVTLADYSPGNIFCLSMVSAMSGRVTLRTPALPLKSFGFVVFVNAVAGASVTFKWKSGAASDIYGIGGANALVSLAGTTQQIVQKFFLFNYPGVGNTFGIEAPATVGGL